MNDKKHVIVIHGGEAWNTQEEYMNYLRDYEFTQEKFDKLTSKRWKDHLQADLGDDFFVIKPKMPNYQNAKYDEWEIWFSKIVPYIKNDAVFVGHSLGANFLAKYLAENDMDISISQLHLVAGCYGWVGGFELSGSLEGVSDTCHDVFIYHSHDDPVVDFSDAKKYQKALPKAVLIDFDDQHHFISERFPEIVQNIKKVL